MTEEEKNLVYRLRLEMLRTGYQPIYIVDSSTLCAVGKYLEEWLLQHNLPPILECGKNGLLFKGCELVLRA